MNLVYFALFMSIVLLKPAIACANSDKVGISAEASAAGEDQEEKFHKSDNELNKLWKQLKTNFKKKTSDWQKLQAEQRKWIKMRDKECEEYFESGNFGTLGPAEGYSCLEEKTQARIHELQSKLQAR